MTDHISFKVGAGEHETIFEIAQRAANLARQHGMKYPVFEADMDVTAVHANGCPLDLPALLAADDADFGHDVFGIWKHIDRNTGELGDCFMPRYALRTAVAR